MKYNHWFVVAKEGEEGMFSLFVHEIYSAWFVQEVCSVYVQFEGCEEMRSCLQFLCMCSIFREVVQQGGTMFWL